MKKRKGPPKRKGNTQLLEAAQWGDLDKVKVLLEQENLDPDFKDSNGRTALSLAAEQGYVEIVRLLLKRIDPDFKDSDDRTALSLAVGQGYVEIVRLLLKQEGIDPDFKDSDDRTLLSLAAQQGNVEIARLLLGQEGIDPNSEDKDKWTPLFWAIKGVPIHFGFNQSAHYTVIELLLNHSKVNPDLKDINGRTPLSLAAELGNMRIVELLLNQSKVNPDLKDNNGRTPLSLAAELWKVEIVELLLKQGHRVDPNSTDETHRTPLFWALDQYRGGWYDSHRCSVVEKLLSSTNVDPDSKDIYGRTPLSLAAELGKVDIVELLLKQGLRVDPNSEDNDNCTPLSWAVEGFRSRRDAGILSTEHCSVILALINHDNINPNVKDINGQTPLSRAAGLWLYHVAEILLKKDDVDRNAKDKQGRTPLLLAVEYFEHQKSGLILTKKCSSVAQLLIDQDNVDLNVKDINGRTALSQAIKLGLSKVVNMLLEKDNIDINGTEENGRTPLLLAVEAVRNEKYSWVENHLSVARSLVNQYKVNLNVKDIKGRTPLSWAVELKLSPVVKMLLKKERVDPNATDNHGRTPLLLAVEAFQDAQDIEIPFCNSVLELLINRDNIDPNIKDTNGRTPLSRAAELRYYRIMETMLKKDNISPDSTDEQVRATLLWAVEDTKGVQEWVSGSERSRILDLLVQRGVNPNFVDFHGRTPLSLAAESGNVAAVKKLLESNHIDPDLKDRTGRTSLQWAARAGQEAVVKLLLAQSTVDPESTDNDCQTPLSSAAEKNYEAIARLLIRKDRTTLHIVVRKGNLAVIKFLMDAKYDVNTKDKHGQTPLHVAASLGHSDIARELIISQANINCEDVNGVTPLRVAIQKRQQDIIEILLEYSAQMNDIMLNEWIDAYHQKSHNMVLELSQSRDGKKRIQFIEETRVYMRLEPEPVRRLLLFVDYSKWLKYVACSLDRNIQIKESQLFHETQVHPKCDNIFVIGYFPTKPSEDQEEFSVSHWEKCGAAWTVVRPSDPKDGSYWRSTNHYGTLPYGWIPDDSATFFALFIRNLEEKWLVLCNSAEEHLFKRRTDQLSERGRNPKLIHGLAEDAQQWATLRRVLRGQVGSAKEFAVEYCRRYDQGRGLIVMQTAIESLSSRVTEQIDRLEQTVKDLLQLEFAWVSINEAHRSTSLATSIKRLSWITFIFLPPMFISSLFGMNVNILENNPDWRWYLLFGGGCLILTVSVWLLFKYGEIETLVEKYIGTPLQQCSEYGMRCFRRRKPLTRTLPK